MDANLSSRKRKLLTNPSHPLLGRVSTRSTSQIHLQRNRSGRSRAFLAIPPSPKQPRTLPNRNDDGDADLCILIKDLRARRVYSPNSIDASKLSTLNIEESCADDAKAAAAAEAEDINETDAILCSVLKEYPVEDAKLDLGISCETLNSEKKGESDDSNELIVQTTPPDAEVFDNNGEVNENQVKPPSVGEAFGANIDNNNNNKNDSISKSKSVLKPCFRRKLFKTPGSVSYKRLLPYLMDITKDNSYTLENSQCSKLDKGLGQKQLQPKLASKGQEVSMDKSNTNSCPMDCSIGESGSSPTSVLISANESSNGTVAHSTLNGHFNESLMSFDSEKLVHECVKESSVNEDNKNYLKPDTSLVLEDDAKGQCENRETEKTGCPSVSEDDDVDIVTPKLSLITDECCSGRDHGVGQHTDDVKQCETGGMKKPKNGYPCKAQNLNPNCSEAENRKSFNLKKRGDNGCQVLNQIDNSNEESVQMTPPDAEENGVGRVELIQKSTDRIGKPLNGTNTRNVVCASDRRNYSHSKSKVVLNPCSGLKLYKSPGSFSYGRLLPFIMDITKDNSCASGNSHHSKLEKDLEKVLVPPYVTSDCQEKPIDNLNGYKFHAEHHNSNCGTLPMAALTSTHESSSDDESGIKSPQDISELTKSLDSQKEHHLQVEQVISDRNSEFVASPNKASSVHEIDPQVAAPSPVSLGALSRVEGTTLASQQVSVDTEADCSSSFTKSSNAAKPVEADNLSQGTPQLEASVPSRVHGTAPKKGILKRNPRGCRGLCTCLNCASFRLHAERAFEFSRNQMQDAEEVALDLMKELSYVRNMLEKSADGVNDHSIVQVYQLKEACRKASEAEELAKHRLGEMNYELNIHCRITCLQPPRVRFANYVEEKVIPKADVEEKVIPKADVEEKVIPKADLPSK